MATYQNHLQEARVARWVKLWPDKLGVWSGIVFLQESEIFSAMNGDTGTAFFCFKCERSKPVIRFGL